MLVAICARPRSRRQGATTGGIALLLVGALPPRYRGLRPWARWQVNLGAAAQFRDSVDVVVKRYAFARARRHGGAADRVGSDADYRA
jgi:hypothetical protein